VLRSRLPDDPTDDELRQFDRTRPGKTVSNDDWENPHDPDATITRMKDGTTRMAYEVEHARACRRSRHRHRSRALRVGMQAHVETA
jgi:hypothetical protein